MAEAVHMVWIRGLKEPEPQIVVGDIAKSLQERLIGSPMPLVEADVELFMRGEVKLDTVASVYVPAEVARIMEEQLREEFFAEDRARGEQADG